jgi:hypothetical protein
MSSEYLFRGEQYRQRFITRGTRKIKEHLLRITISHIASVLTERLHYPRFAPFSMSADPRKLLCAWRDRPTLSINRGSELHLREGMLRSLQGDHFPKYTPHRQLNRQDIPYPQTRGVFWVNREVRTQSPGLSNDPERRWCNLNSTLRAPFLMVFRAP